MKNMKANKSQFGYVENRPHTPRCNKCRYFVLNNGCTLVGGNISGSNGSCTLWVKGSPKLRKDIPSPLTQGEGGYVEYPGGPRCGVCRFYYPHNKCSLVEGKIDPEYGCCNAWKKSK